MFVLSHECGCIFSLFIIQKNPTHFNNEVVHLKTILLRKHFVQFSNMQVNDIEILSAHAVHDPAGSFIQLKGF